MYIILLLVILLPVINGETYRRGKITGMHRCVRDKVSMCHLYKGENTSIVYGDGPTSMYAMCAEGIQTNRSRAQGKEKSKICVKGVTYIGEEKCEGIEMHSTYTNGTEMEVYILLPKPTILISYRKLTSKYTKRLKQDGDIETSNSIIYYGVMDKGEYCIPRLDKIRNSSLTINEQQWDRTETNFKEVLEIVDAILFQSFVNGVAVGFNKSACTTAKSRYVVNNDKGYPLYFGVCKELLLNEIPFEEYDQVGIVDRTIGDICNFSVIDRLAEATAQKASIRGSPTAEQIDAINFLSNHKSARDYCRAGAYRKPRRVKRGNPTQSQCDVFFRYYTDRAWSSCSVYNNKLAGWHKCVNTVGFWCRYNKNHGSTEEGSVSKNCMAKIFKYVTVHMRCGFLNTEMLLLNIEKQLLKRLGESADARRLLLKKLNDVKKIVNINSDGISKVQVQTATNTEELAAIRAGMAVIRLKMAEAFTDVYVKINVLAKLVYELYEHVFPLRKHAYVNDTATLDSLHNWTSQTNLADNKRVNILKLMVSDMKEQHRKSIRERLEAERNYNKTSRELERAERIAKENLEKQTKENQRRINETREALDRKSEIEKDRSDEGRGDLQTGLDGLKSLGLKALIGGGVGIFIVLAVIVVIVVYCCCCKR